MHRTAMPRTRMAQVSLAAALLGIAACAGTPNTPLATKTSRFHANYVPSGSLRIAEVTELDMQLEGGKVLAYRAKVKLSFKYED